MKFLYFSFFMAVFFSSAVVADTFYVSESGSNTSPYGSWATAAANIQDAVDVAVTPGDTVLVTNGVYRAGGAVTPGYNLNNRVCVINDLQIRSVNGPEVMIIAAAGAMRGVYLSAGTLSGFAVTNGITWESGGVWEYDRSGGGLWLGTGTTARNCVVFGNSAATGGGVFLFNGGPRLRRSWRRLVRWLYNYWKFGGSI